MKPVSFTIAIWVLFSAYSFSQQPSTIKKITVKVADAQNNKPVENAEVTFRGLLFKKTKKTDSEGKVLYDILLFGESQKINIEVKDETPGSGHKTYQTSINLLRGQENYEVLASMKPAFKKLTISVTDENKQPLSNAAVIMNGDAGGALNTMSNGVVTMVVPAEGSIIPLTISKDGYETFKMNLDVNDQGQAPVVTALKKAGGTRALYDMSPGTNTNTNTNPNPSNISNSNQGGGSTPENSGNTGTNTVTPAPNDNTGPLPVDKKTTGPYNPVCDANPRVPPIEDWEIPPEKEFSDYITDECLKPVNDYAAALKQYALQMNYFSGDIEKTAKTVDNAIALTDKLWLLHQKLGVFFSTPQLYAAECVSKAAIFYVSADAYQLKSSYKDAKAVNDELEKNIKTLRDKIKFNQDVSNDKLFSGTFFFNAYQVFSNASKTAGAVTHLLNKLTNWEEWLSYSEQAGFATSRAEELLANLSRTCKVFEAEKEITEAVNKGKLALAAARIDKARWEAKQIKKAKEINELTKNHIELTAWKSLPANSSALNIIRPAYNEWVFIMERIRGAEKAVEKLEAQLTNTGKLCARLAELVPAINERVKAYNDLVSKGYAASRECEFKEAEDILKQVQRLENGECGHYFPRMYQSQKSSEGLESDIKFQKETVKCKAKLPPDPTGSVKIPSALPNEKMYGPFSIEIGKWKNTDINLKKGQFFRVAYYFGNWNYKEGAKTIVGPDGGGYWRWFVLKAKIGEQMYDVGSKGSWQAPEAGVLHLGAPATRTFGHGDEAGMEGIYWMYVFVTGVK